MDISGGNMKKSWLIKHVKHGILDDLEFVARSYYFPDEILAEILKRLPVKSILRCRSVRKSWYDLIKSHFFINLHLSYQQKSTLLLFETLYNSYYSLRFDDEHCQEYYKFKIHPNLPGAPGWVSSSYGLICLSTMYTCGRLLYTGDIYLWNPLIHKYITVPEAPSVPLLDKLKVRGASLAFGFLPKVKDHVVIKMVHYCWRNNADQEIMSTMICVYSLIINSWRKIIQDCVFIGESNTYDWVFVRGAAFWRGENREGVDILVCFDTKNDILREISLPEIPTADIGNPTLHQFGESVAFFVEDGERNAFNMWILKEATENEFVWEKKVTLNLDNNIIPYILGVRNNGEVLLSREFEFSLISYNVDKDEQKDFVDSWDRWYSPPASRDGLYLEDCDPPPFNIVVPFFESLTLLLDHH